MKQPRRLPTLLLTCALGACTSLDGPPELGIDEASIRGGVNEPRYLHPWRVQLGRGCGGTLITPEWVLTAAHCADEWTMVYHQYVDPVTHALVKTSRESAEHIPYPGHTTVAGLQQRDVGLIRVSPPFPTNEFIRPVGLPRQSLTAGRPGALAANRDEAPLPDDQLAVYRGTTGQLLENNMFYMRVPGQALCDGDSGSGFVTVDRCERVVTGVASEATIGCPADSRSELESVFAYRDWIAATTGLPLLPDVSRCTRRNHIVWQETSGQVAIWFMDGASRVGDTYPAVVGGDWAYQGAGDFDGDGQGDLAWRNPATGEVKLWFVQNGWIRSSTSAPAGIAWTIQGVADFTGDGKSDLLWRESTGQLAIWPSGANVGALLPGYDNTPSPVPNEWQVRGAGDFDGDGYADILWRRTDGQHVIWFMRGGTRVGEAAPGTADPSWSVQGVADFDGNLRADVLFRNASGQLRLWFDGDASRVGTPSYLNQGGTVPSTWTIRGLGDFDLDGRADILWRQSNGDVAQWFMDGARFVRDAYPARALTAWQVRGLVENR